MKQFIIEFAGYTCNVHSGQYGNGRTAITLIDAEDHQPVATATVNLPDASLNWDEVIIKAYSENTGMTDALVKAGIVYPPRRQIDTGFVTVDVCRLTLDGMDLIPNIDEIMDHAVETYLGACHV